MKILCNSGRLPFTALNVYQSSASRSALIAASSFNQRRTMASKDLSSEQKTLVDSVLETFKGKATKERLALLTDDATFQDPICIAQGRKQYEAQFFGLNSAFSEIENLSAEVVDAGNPIKIAQKQKYVVKGLGTEKIVDSIIEIHTTPGGDKITKIFDKWDGEPLPDGPIKNAFRRLNASTVPHLVSVPKERSGPAGNN